MENLNFVSVSSYALKNHCSFIGGKPFCSVLKGLNGQMVFMFHKEHYGNDFFQWVEENAENYKFCFLRYRGEDYATIFFPIPQKIERKFLLAFRQFARNCEHLVNYF